MSKKPECFFYFSTSGHSHKIDFARTFNVKLMGSVTFSMLMREISIIKMDNEGDSFI